MNNQAFSKIWIVVIVLIFIAGGILTWQYWWLPKEEMKVPEEISEEINAPTGWKSYANEEIGISFYYPPEWGEVRDYLDYLGLTDGQKESFKQSEKAEKGEYLTFSNLYRKEDWGPNIRITSVQKIVSQMSEFLSLQKGSPERAQHLFFPLLGMRIPELVLESSPELVDEFSKAIEEIASLPQGAPAESLKGPSDSVFIFFASGLSSGQPERKQIITTDRSLQGIVTTGVEGWDVAGRAYYDVILVSQENKQDLIYISFTLEKSPQEEAKTIDIMVKSIRFLK